MMHITVWIHAPVDDKTHYEFADRQTTAACLLCGKPSLHYVIGPVRAIACQCQAASPDGIKISSVPRGAMAC